MTTSTRTPPQTLFDVAGGHDKIFALTTAFYDKALADPLLKALFKAGDADHAKYLAGWFSVVFGGPQTYLEERGDLAFVIWKHVSMKISDAQRARWVSLMRQAAAEVDISSKFMVPFDRFIDQISRSVQENSHIPRDELAQMLGGEPGLQS